MQHLLGAFLCVPQSATFSLRYLGACAGLSALARSRTSSGDRPKNLATQASATPLFKASIRNSRSALFHAVFTVCSLHSQMGYPVPDIG